MADLTGSDRPMRDVAESTGGAVLSIDQVGSLPERISRALPAEMRYIEHPLWDSGWLFGLLVACFTAEWAIRKRVGLV
jgi:hypothetical protein